jgi:hypothetical protein
MRDELMAADADGRVAVYLGDGQTWDRQAAVVFHKPLDGDEEPRFQARYVVGVDTLVRFWLQHGGYDAGQSESVRKDAVHN